jgi:hypothetical protein
MRMSTKQLLVEEGSLLTTDIFPPLLQILGQQSAQSVLSSASRSSPSDLSPSSVCQILISQYPRGSRLMCTPKGVRGDVPSPRSALASYTHRLDLE